jgi:hypothetical protein
MKRYEYIEGPQALENFENAMKAIFQAQKPESSKKKQPRKAATLRKSKAHGKGKD